MMILRRVCLALLGIIECWLVQAQTPAAVVTVGVVLTSGTNLAYDYDILAPALEAAYERSLTSYNVQFEPELFLYQGGCSVSNAAGQTHLAAYKNVDFIVGPGCTDDMMMSLETQTFFLIPSVTGAGDLVDSTAKFPYTTRCAYSTYTQWIFAVRMFKKFNWTNAAIIYDTEISAQVVNANSLMNNIRNANFRYVDLPISGSAIRETDQAQKFLIEASKQARVIVILTTGILLRTFMIGASRLGYTNGEYVFYGLDPFRDDILGKNGWKQGDNYDAEARRAYGSLFVLSLRDTSQEPKYQEFAKNVQDTAVRLFPLMTTVTLNYFVASFFDAILLYALSVNETLEMGHSIGKDNVLELSTKFWNRTFPGATGQVYINPAGDRNDDHAIHDLDENGVFQVAAEFFGYKDVLYNDYSFDQIIPFLWNNPSNTPPPNEPRCGHTGENPICDMSGQTLGISLGVVGAIVAISLLFGIVTYQILHRRSELAQLDVLGTWREISKAQTSVIRVNKKSTEMGSHTSFDQNALQSGTFSATFAPGHTVTAFFRGTRVMLRVCEREQLHITRTILNEVKNVRSIQNDNVSKLEGLCTGPHRVAVMYGYCAKGSLADLLASEVVKLDWLFRFSLIKDFVNGLFAIDSSPLMCHGRLTSRCIFVDAHFVAKVADYGLPSFFARSMPSTQDSAFCSTLLWTAPERLSLPFGPGTQEGDVYSLAIILAEVVMRERPYGSMNLEPEVIVAKLQQKQYKSFRPRVDANLCPPEISVLMKQCWALNPLERPRLAQIKSIIKESEKSNSEKGTILDNLIRRMENYTIDLEHVVQEKAQQFLLEKEKSEQLLYQILPRTVVDTLKRGERVMPENFDSVTVYYSDIVAFTTLSSQSSPNEVVDLLNDLYTIFDNCIMKFDAYKEHGPRQIKIQVETVGDCYVVASGVPIRNGNRHAGEICRLSLLLLDQINVFKIRHRPDEKLRLRLGAHTGPCVSGVVGLVMPRFCLFGETITIAGKMESSSMPMRIQISDACERMLQTLGKFDVELRDAPVVVNDKLEIITYWLHRELPS